MIFTLFLGKTFANSIGDIQQAAIGLESLLKSSIILVTSGSTSKFFPLKAKLHRFLATPKPPGKTSP